jgi:hypothetical protein
VNSGRGGHIFDLRGRVKRLLWIEEQKLFEQERTVLKHRRTGSRNLVAPKSERVL